MTSKDFAFNGSHQNNLLFRFLCLVGCYLLCFLLSPYFAGSPSGRSAECGWGVNLDALSHGSTAAPGITHCQSTEAFNSFSCADMPVPLTPPSERDEQTLFHPPPHLLHQMWESQPFVPIFFHPLLFIPLTLCRLFFSLDFFLEVMG